MTKLENKVAIITGGASGVGNGIAKAFVKEGARVVIVDYNDEAGKQAIEELQLIQPDSIFIHADLADFSTHSHIISKTVDTFGQIDILVNNAQSSRVKPFQETTQEDLELPFKTGFFPTFYLMQYALPYLKEAKGHIINFASGAGITGEANQAAYAAAKEAVRGLSRVVANEFGPYGVKVNVICPFANSPGVKQWAEHMPDAFAETLSKIPLRRVGDVEEDIGRAVVFFASQDSDYITGQTLMVDGGGCRL
ncbi:SDR family NAD(P)-dependent oxidoreductase [Paenibacillus sp. FSL H7-0331]|uniref:SDR family NAD(P)-dependent oxidoreductase n=1 Tax=Paenibacillus sp. FSL H7-0331 TaxID=1920421 RepID=UPI00096C4F40|nr:SDR family oxidoreductase [Paenibacillus sp. FSL H7-0331]OMF04310.1 oxidoreductase [Paenibacillus sp. FSL H7-0331]